MDTKKNLEQVLRKRTSGVSNERRYFVNKIRAHMMKIRNEIDVLMKQSAGTRMSACLLQEYKKKAKKKAKIYSELERELTLLNVVLQMNLRRYSYEKILTDILAIKRNNEEVLTKLDEFFEFKRHLEDLSENLKSELGQIKTLASVELPVEEKEAAEKCKIEETKAAIARYRRVSDESFFRTKRRQHLLMLNVCIAQRDGLLRECDPNIALQTLRDDKEKIRELECQRKQLEENLRQLKADFETIESIEAAPEINTNTKDAETTVEEIRLKRGLINDTLDYLLLKQDKYTDFSKISDFTQVTSIEAFLQHLKKLKAFESEYEKQLKDLWKTLHERKCQIKKIQLIDEAIEEISERGMQLEEQKSCLQVSLTSTTTAVETLKQRLLETQWLLERDQRYTELQSLDEKCECLLQENSKMEEQLVLEKRNEEIDGLSRQIDTLARQCNEKLIRRLKGRIA